MKTVPATPRAAGRRPPRMAAGAKVRHLGQESWPHLRAVDDTCVRLESALLEAKALAYVIEQMSYKVESRPLDPAFEGLQVVAIILHERLAHATGANPEEAAHAAS